MVTRVIVGIIAGVLLLMGIASGAAAAWGYLTMGTDGLVRVDAGTIQPGAEAEAIVVDVERFSVDVPYIGALGETALSASSVDAGADPLFLGAASTPDVDAYLVGMPYSAAFRSGDTWSVRDVPGSAPLAPTSSATWLVQDTGARPAVSVPGARPLSLVILRPSGSPTGAVRLSIDFTVAEAANWLLGLVIAAAVLIIVGVLLLFLALRRRRPRGKHALGATAEAAPVATMVEEPAVVEPASEEVAEVAEVAAEVAEVAAEEPVVVEEPPVSASEETSELPIVVVEEPVVVEPALDTLPVVDEESKFDEESKSDEPG